MDGFQKISKTAYIFILILVGSSLSLQPEEADTIRQAEAALQIDGDLSDWEPYRNRPVFYTTDGRKVEPTPDIAVTARFTFDASRFYCSVLAEDDSFSFPSRSWRYGDGLYLTFVEPNTGGESERFSSFGFSLEDGQTVKALVNRDGTYFPSHSNEDILCVILADEEKSTIVYEIAIPFKDIVPFRPFIHKKWAVNLIYVDGEKGERQILQLHPDPNYDTEMTNLRKGRVFHFESRSPSSPEFQSQLSASHFYHDAEKILTAAVNAPAESSGWTIRYELSSAFENVSSVNDVNLQQAMNTFSFPLDIGEGESGIYDISVGVIDNKDSLRFREDHQFFVLKKEDISRWSEDLQRARESEVFTSSLIFRESFPTVEIRLEWIKSFMDEAPPFSDIQRLKQWTVELESLSQRIKEGNPALFQTGQISRLAHRSGIDDTLQPYSLFVPFDYEKKKPLPLIVTLHGSGVDELNTIRYMSEQAAERGSFIVLAPKARGLSDWYIGHSGEDVLECLAHVQKLYSVDERNIILDGFSMGGYGAWRLSCLYPDRFRAVIVRSGAIQPPPGIKGEKILELLEKKAASFYLIVHGEQDISVPVENARRAAAKLKELGIGFEYIEIKEAAHGGYDRWKEIFDWIRRIMAN